MDGMGAIMGAWSMEYGCVVSGQDIRYGRESCNEEWIRNGCTDGACGGTDRGNDGANRVRHRRWECQTLVRELKFMHCCDCLKLPTTLPGSTPACLPEVLHSQAEGNEWLLATHLSRKLHRRFLRHGKPDAACQVPWLAPLPSPAPHGRAHRRRGQLTGCELRDTRIKTNTRIETTKGSSFSAIIVGSPHTGSTPTSGDQSRSSEIDHH